MLKNFTLTIKGSDGGQLDVVDIILGNTDVPLDSDDDVTFTNDGIDIDFTPPLSISLTIKAVKGTTWDIVVQEKDAADPCYKTSGKTGDQPGDSQPNTSVRNTNTTCK